MKSNNYNTTTGSKLRLVFILLLGLLITGCKKFVTVDSLTDKMLAAEVFNSESTANSAMNGIYRTFRGHFQQAYSISILTGIAGDELYDFAPQPIRDQFKDNQIQSTNAQLQWSGFYNIIYQCNGAIEGLEQSTQLNIATKNQYMGEAKFIRSFCYFYLVNLFGEVPLLTSTAVSVNAVAKKTPIEIVYNQMVDDLKESETLMGVGYSFSGGEKIRANKWSASSLLARVYLYQQNWPAASSKATEVINSGTYHLLNNVDSVAIKNNREAILQLATGPTETNLEASFFIFTTSNPVILCKPSLLSSFETGDQRRSKWIKTGTYISNTYNYPNKYKSAAVNSNEYSMLLRLGELYLIRAEAWCRQDNYALATIDLNTLRQKHGGLNTPLPVPLDQSACMLQIMRERRVELFAEGGHRWFDLKRTGAINETMNLEKPGKWQVTDALWPIPLADIQRNTGLTQNAGYE